MTEDFADQLSFMKSDFNEELEKIAKERKEASEEHASEIKKVRGEFDKSLSEFRSYVTTVFTKQDTSMKQLQEECRNTNTEMIKWREKFSEDVIGLKEGMAAIMQAVGAGSPQARQYGVPATMAAGHTAPNVIAGSPLAGYKSDSFTGMSPLERARQIREAQIAAQKTFELDRINNMKEGNNNVDLSMSPVGETPQK